MGPTRTALLAVFLGYSGLAPATASGHQPAPRPPEPSQPLPVEFVGRSDPDLDTRVRRFLLQPDYLIVAEDTLIARGDTVPRPMLVLDATVYVEGVVEGSILSVEGQVFLRPPAVVHGDVVNLAGGLYPSGLAQVHGERIDRPLASYAVERYPDRFVIRAWIDRPRFLLDGVYGLGRVDYDRVDALTLSWGAAVALGPRRDPATQLHGRVDYRSARGAWTGGGEFRHDRRRLRVRAGAERATLAANAWLLPDLPNSLAFLFAARDYRDYYDARRAYAAARYELGPEHQRLGFGLRLQRERTASLRGREPWTLRGDPRVNPTVSDGVIASVTAIADGELAIGSSQFTIGGSVEAAGDAAGGEFRFVRYALWGDAEMPALANHSLIFAWRFQAPFPGTDPLPEQRFGLLGGRGTLPAFAVGEFRGDRLLLVRSDYVIPLPSWLRLPVIGPPDLHLQHRMGTAWLSEEPRPSLEQNVGVELRFTSPYLQLATDPSRARDALRLEFGFSWPLDRAPWADQL